MFAVDDLTRWSNLRSFGNASLVRYSALVPIFGYLIIFNQEIVKLLTIPSEFCVSPDRCRITWKLMSLYLAVVHSLWVLSYTLQAALRSSNDIKQLPISLRKKKCSMP